MEEVVALLHKVSARSADAEPAKLLLGTIVDVSLETSSFGASFATSSGDILEVSSFGYGVFRLRIGPRTLPDYGIVQQSAERCAVTQGTTEPWQFVAGDAMLELEREPLRFRLLWKGQPIFGSITDQHFRGFVRLPTFGRLRQGGLWTAAFAPAAVRT